MEQSSGVLKYVHSVFVEENALFLLRLNSVDFLRPTNVNNV